MPFEFRYTEKQYGANELKDLLDFQEEKKIERGYVVNPGDFGEFAGLNRRPKSCAYPLLSCATGWAKWNWKLPKKAEGNLHCHRTE